MNWYHASIQNKFLLGLGVLTAGLSATVLWGFGSLWSSILAFDDLNRNAVSQERAILRTTITFKEQVQEWKDVLLRGKNTEAQLKHWNAFIDKESRVRDGARQLIGQVNDAGSRKLLQEFLGAHEAMGAGYRKGYEAFKQAGADSGVGDAAVKGVDRLPTQVLEKAAHAIAENSDQRVITILGDARRGAATSLALFVAVTAVMLFILVIFVKRNISRPIGEAVNAAQALAQGDLTLVVEVRSRDEIGRLLAAIGNSATQLKGMVQGIKDAAGSIGAATVQIAQGNADLSQRTEEQASSLEETASSMEELTSTVKQNAQNARQANQLAVGASAVAVKGGEVVGEVVETMSAINESSKKIVDIIGVIDGIAFQTNILALNAAVEAARAGEQGRGFAVVASEVRSLAQRSAEAAKEIKALIGDSVEKVGAGTKLVDEAGKTMQEIVASVKRVTDIMAEITAASAEQSAGIEQVNQAIAQMDEVTQQNAALVEEAAAAAESLEEQSQHLLQAVMAFKLGDVPVDATPLRASALNSEAVVTMHRHGPARTGRVARLPLKSAKASIAALRERVVASGSMVKRGEV